MSGDEDAHIGRKGIKKAVGILERKEEYKNILQRGAGTESQVESEIQLWVALCELASIY